MVNDNLVIPNGLTLLDLLLRSPPKCVKRKGREPYELGHVYNDWCPGLPEGGCRLQNNLRTGGGSKCDGDDTCDLLFHLPFRQADLLLKMVASFNALSMPSVIVSR